jgi:catechol 2,3-dioxygenase-like lactoylglutathione lyase family enzyme
VDPGAHEGIVVNVTSIDHLVITVRDLDETVAFYERLGMRHAVSPAGRHALTFGSQKLNVHVAGHEIEPHADRPTPGSADVCLLVDSLAGIEELGPFLGPVERNGATGTLRSFYLRDPDGNLVELSVAL